jgi:hypothetical protein
MILLKFKRCRFQAWKTSFMFDLLASKNHSIKKSANMVISKYIGNLTHDLQNTFHL